jgi:hypothetical protein
VVGAFAGRLDAARHVADQAAAALTVVVRQAEQRQLSQQLRQALDSRAVIGPAVGIVMSLQGCEAQTALTVLRRTSQHRNVRLRRVAEELIASVTGAGGGSGTDRNPLAREDPGPGGWS